jgi:hypothetical protein
MNPALGWGAKRYVVSELSLDISSPRQVDAGAGEERRVSLTPQETAPVSAVLTDSARQRASSPSYPRS